jgi:hypothetical protein
LHITLFCHTLSYDLSLRYQPEILDALCFPSSLQPQDTPAPGPSSKKAAAPPFSSLDGLLQLLKQAPQLLAGQPKLLAGVMRVLVVLWENQGAAHGAVELLRAQPELWQGLKVRPDAICDCDSCMLLSCCCRAQNAVTIERVYDTAVASTVGVAHAQSVVTAEQVHDMAVGTPWSAYGWAPHVRQALQMGQECLVGKNVCCNCLQCGAQLCGWFAGASYAVLMLDHIMRLLRRWVAWDWPS